jgi:DNA invertase Pin-like site-specific DNA recombinase
VTERAAVYARISEDPLGLEKGVGRQLEDGRELARVRGWQVVGEFVDNDITALRGRPRERYADLMAAVDRGEVTRIVAYMTSRLWRNRREHADAIDRLARARVAVAAVKGPDLDFSTAAGRMLAGVLGEFDTHESEVKGERVARAALQRAQEGRANGAALYGWRREYERDQHGRVLGFRDLVDDAEAYVVRRIVDQLLAGASLRDLADELNARGLPSPNGKRWGTSSVRKVALRPANIARRVHAGEVIGPAAWPLLIDEDRHARVVALLQDPGRRTARSGARRHLLTYGVGRCGICRGQLRVATKKGAALYVCEARGCVGRREERVDDLVEQVVLDRLARPDAQGIFARTDDVGRAARERADALRARLDTAADEYAAGRITAAQLVRITASLRPDLQAAEADASRAVRGLHPDALAGLTGDPGRDRWDQLSVAQQRAVLETLFDAVTILPTRQGPGFDPTSVGFDWRTQ